MNLNGLKKVLLYGEHLEYHLFKTAISFAETGTTVWFISPKAFEEIPHGIEMPEKDVLKLIIFLYLKDCGELLQHLNEIHSWCKMPQVIICNAIENYISLDSDCLPQSAFILSNLIDATKTCSNKHGNSAQLIVSYHNLVEDNYSNLRLLTNLYFDNVVRTTSQTDTIYL